MEKRQFPHRVDDTSPIWIEFRELTERYKCLSLGEGAPSHNPPEFLLQSMIKAIRDGYNQYNRTYGLPEFSNQIGQFYSSKLNRKLNPMTEVHVTGGANTAIFELIMGLIEPNQQEEVVVFEPYFPQYADHIQIACGVFVPIPLHLDQNDGKWAFDRDLFKQKINDKTRILILNNAHNPTGKIFTIEELKFITSIIEKYPRIIVISDDVYESLAYDDKQVTLYASIGDNFNRTVSVFSGGKIFSATGWKVGWMIGPEDILNAASLIALACQYCVNVPAQKAMADGLQIIQSEMYQDGMLFLQYQNKEFQKVRDYFYDQLSDNQNIDLPMRPVKSESGYFILADISLCKDVIPKRFLGSHDYEILEEGTKPISKNQIYMEDGRVPLDLAFCRWIAVERGVIMMPCSLFYHKTSPYRNDHFVRIAICKGMDHSAKAMERLKAKKE